jgi:hypothetical protein
MKRNQIVKTLINEGFSEKTLVNFSDKQLGSLYQRIIGEGEVFISSKDPKFQEKLQSAKQSGKTIETYESTKNGDDSYDITIEYKESEKDGGRIFKKKYNISAKNKEEAKKIAKDKWNEKFEKSDLSIVNILCKSEIKEWVKGLAKENFHNFTSKNEIMELIQTKMTQDTPSVKKGHNGIPEFMSYDSITQTEVGGSETTTKPAPVKPKTTPDTKPKPRTPYSPKPGEKSKPKALKEKNEVK